MYSIIIGALALGAVAVPTERLSLDSITYDNFASIEANIGTRQVNPGRYMDPSGELPKVYDFAEEGIRYNPEGSWQVFQDIRSGKRAGDKTDEELYAAQNATLAERALLKRQEQTVEFELEGGNGQVLKFTETCGADPGAACNSPPNRPYVRITVFAIGQCHFRFWSSSRCNGGNGRYGPLCGGDVSQTCPIVGNPSSYAIFNRCEQNAENNACQ